MSFGTSGFGSGFGQQNNTTQPSAFGGFGSSTTNTGSAFGAPATNTGFGATNTTMGGGLFGGGGSSFGASTGGFGQTNSAFGAAKPAFGAATSTAGGGLFGSSTPATAGSTGGFGGFGQTNTASTSTPFGGGGSSLFGQKPATTFGATTTPAAGSSLFGSGGASTGGFGSTGTTFGATNNPGLGAVGDPPGTAQVPFTATTEKELNNPTQTNAYQNILFQEPYKKWSAEELRLADYNQGRRHGNATGTGAFGVSSGFGSTGFGTNTAQSSTGFGATSSGTGLFGSSQPAATGFGQTATSTGGFGSSGGGLFGQASKPAGTGLFGSNPAQPAQTTGLFGGSGTTGFGNTANTGTGFGSTANTTTGGGLFGQAATPAKPSGFGFGSTGATTGGFGAASTTGGFGANAGTTNTGSGLFGGASTQQPAAGGGLFGNAQQQQQNTGTGFGSTGAFGQQNQAAGSSLFNQPKPGGTGLFGSTTQQPATGTGLFGSSTTSNPFGGATNTQQQSGGLFGSKPAATGTGLFGSTTQQPASTGTGLFGSLGSNTQNQQSSTGTGLFGSLGQNQQQKPSPFGSTLGQGGGGGLFGSQNTQQSGGLFGGANQQQQQQGGLGGSLFGGSQASQAPQSLSTSINDLSAYGSASLFSGLGGNETQNPGPLATPLSSNKNKVKSRSILPMYKLSPANASRFVTPQKRGFGFSYSTYGTPSSVSSVSSTPGGLGQSLLIGSNNRGLSKSISTSSLRRSFNVEDSILAPGSFSASSGPRVTGGHKKLIINKDMRSDLFTSPAKSQSQETSGARKLTKRVSFETSTNQAIENGNQGSGTNTPDESTDARDLGYIRPTNRQTNGVNGTKPAPESDIPEMEQVKGKELAIVHEEEPAPPAVRVNQHLGDKEPGEYWMSPSKDQILAMNRVQRQKVENFAVGREHVGSVSFKVPVDLSNVDLDELCGNIVILEPRSATVYPIAAKKPPVGKGLNVPATISLEQSWPRRDKRIPVHDKTGSRIAKHIERLKRIENTKFEEYDAEHGIWTFSVEHFTTYGLDDDDEEDETEAEVQPPAAVTAKAVQPQDSPSPAVASPDVDPDDTFEFKRSRRPVPGAFDDGTALSDDEEMGDSDQLQRLPSPEPEMAEIREEYNAPRDDESMADDGYEGGGELVRVPSSAAESEREEEEDYRLSRSVGNDPQVPAGIMRARMRAVKKSTAPTKIQVAGGDDWTQILQQSVRAPRRMDRATLRALNESGAAWEMEERGSPVSKQQQSAADTAGFATSIDLMKSLFEQSKGPAQSVQGMAGKGFVKWPYQRRDKVAHEQDEAELAYRSAPRVEWGDRSTAVLTVNDSSVAQSRIAIIKSVEGEELSKVPNLQIQMDLTEIKSVHGVPTVVSRGPVTIKSLASGDDKVWELASVLFDNDGADLSTFWEKLVVQSTDLSLAEAKSHEERAIACLAGNQVSEACKHLLAAKDFRLATLVAAVGANEGAKKDISEQLKNWQESNVLSEFSEPIRAIYEILAGNTCVCSGTKGVPIENRIESFVISERFSLDWMQAFGLRLWHGGFKSVAEAVQSFKSDIEQDREEEPESPLWGLLKLFAGRRVDYGDYGLSWQLGRALHSNGNVSFGDRAEEKLDEMTNSFAAQLIAKGEWVPALFVLIHLSDPAARAAAIREQLGRNAHLIDDKDKDRVLSTLTQTLKIPAAWIWEAKALHARAVLRDPTAEFAYLLLAEDWAEANRTFLRRVAPTAVIRRRYDELFEQAKLLYRIRDRLPDWSTGAAVYLLFPATRGWDEARLPSWIDTLTQGIVALRQNTAEENVLETAAIADMAEDLVRVGERVWRKGGEGRLYKLAGGLPLTEDRRQKYLRDLVYEGMAMVGGH